MIQIMQQRSGSEKAAGALRSAAISFRARTGLRCLCRSQGRGCRLCTSGSLGRPETRSTFCSWSSRCATGAAQRRCTYCPRDLRQQQQTGAMSEPQKEQNELICNSLMISVTQLSCNWLALDKQVAKRSIWSEKGSVHVKGLIYISCSDLPHNRFVFLPQFVHYFKTNEDVWHIC